MYFYLISFSVQFYLRLLFNSSNLELLFLSINNSFLSDEALLLSFSIDFVTVLFCKDLISSFN